MRLHVIFTLPSTDHEVDSFLDDVSRIIDPSYEPSDADVVRARLRTLGVQEYPFTFEKGTFTSSSLYTSTDFS